MVLPLLEFLRNTVLLLMFYSASYQRDTPSLQPSIHCLNDVKKAVEVVTSIIMKAYGNNQAVIVMSYKNVHMTGLNVKFNRIHVEMIHMHYSKTQKRRKY